MKPAPLKFYYSSNIKAILGWESNVKCTNSIVCMGGKSQPSQSTMLYLWNTVSSCVCYSHYSLKGNLIGDAGAQDLAEGLQHCTNLQKLE